MDNKLLPVSEAMELVIQALENANCPEKVRHLPCKKCPYKPFCNKLKEAYDIIQEIALTPSNRTTTDNYALYYEMESGWTSNSFMIYLYYGEPYLVGGRPAMTQPRKLGMQEWEDLKITLTAMSKKWSKAYVPPAGCDFPESKVTLNFGDFNRQTFYQCMDVEYLLTKIYEGKSI